MSSNSAAWLVTEGQKPLVVKSADARYPDEDEIVVKNAAIAINQVDWKLQDDPWEGIEYPVIMGEDVAGEVVSIGSAVTRFKVGDRVIGHAVSLATEDDRHAGFQKYTVLMSNMASPIPRTLSFESAVVLPLGMSTAAAALFQKEYLELPRPSLNSKRTGTTLLVWGGTTSVGSNAIQLAVAAGCEVIATASPKNFDYVKKLGASQVIDYRSPTVVKDLITAFNGKRLAGAFDTVGSDETIQSTIAAVSKINGKKVVASVLEVPEEGLPKGITGKDVIALDIRENEVSSMIYEDYLPSALAEGKYIAAPEPYVAGKGLGSVQAGLDAQKKVSAQKVVITL